MTKKVFCARGGLAKSDFRTRQLLDSIRATLALSLHSLQANHCYFLSVAPSPETNRQIESILGIIDSEAVDRSALVAENLILVAPRLGTTSAWSTKASDILNRCGFSRFDRIERGTVWHFECDEALSVSQKSELELLLHDRMTESVLRREQDIGSVFSHRVPTPTRIIDVLSDGISALETANQEMGLALSGSELAYLHEWFVAEARNPTETELMMFSQVNSEHCRHKIFNSSWSFDGEKQAQSMFSMIRATHKGNPQGTLVAYEDNAAVIAGQKANLFAPKAQSNRYQYLAKEPSHIVFKAETHNHPTAISPYPGAATGAGGEIRDEGATGIGGKPKAGICGFSVSHLRIPGNIQPWELAERRPGRIASPLQIMLDGPIGAASFNNEFGRPNIGGYFRTFETSNLGRSHWYGFHKPIMFAGGIGSIRPQHISKRGLSAGDLLIVIGGPSMLIGLGGGAASSLGQGRSEEDLDFASVQRSNPEMQRRCQETIDRCRELGTENPILSIHDVGAGGLSNALPEIVHAAGRGAEIGLQQIPVDDTGMSPMEIWCNEAQERYVLAVQETSLSQFAEICRRENCPWQVVGQVTQGDTLVVKQDDSEDAVNVSLDFLLGAIPQPDRKDRTRSEDFSEQMTAFDVASFADCARRTLRFPSVADKSFLITIGDRTVSGLIHRDQMVGPWQVPVADAAVTLAGYQSYCGEAMGIGERSPIAVLDAAASARIAVGEALTNLRSASVDTLSEVKICANWMASASVTGESKALYDAVRSVAEDVCLKLGLSVPVGKDSLSMSTEWQGIDGNQARVHAPVSLVATAFAPLRDVRHSLTPQLKKDPESELILIDLGAGKDRMGMSVAHQAHNHVGGSVPDIDEMTWLEGFFNAIGALIKQGQLLAYHDRSDGGLFATLCEMAFAGRVGLDIQIKRDTDPIAFFFNEELGAVIQIERHLTASVMNIFDEHGIGHLVQTIGSISLQDELGFSVNDRLVFNATRTELHRVWSELSWKMQSRRDNPDDAKQEYDRILDADDPGLSFDWDPKRSQNREQSQAAEPQSFIAATGARPTVAVLREQGVNGHIEMAAAFDRAGFEAVDVVMADLVSGRCQLSQFSGIVIGGGFSFGDVFGAGRGWANIILQHSRLRDMFESYFANPSKFVLGVCNGCQVIASLKEIIPGAMSWPGFCRNHSEQFEARLVMVEVTQGKSVFTMGMEGAILPVAVAHGEGRARFDQEADYRSLVNNQDICLRYVDNRNQPAERYPDNPNGSHGAIAGVTNSDGRITVMMPHPERVFRQVQYSWAPQTDREDSAWMQMFRSARNWLS